MSKCKPTCLLSSRAQTEPRMDMERGTGCSMDDAGDENAKESAGACAPLSASYKLANTQEHHRLSRYALGNYLVCSRFISN